MNVYGTIKGKLMIIKDPKHIENIKTRKPTLVKNFHQLKGDFTWLSKLLDSHEHYAMLCKSRIFDLYGIWQIRGLNNINTFMEYYTFFQRLFNYVSHPDDNSDLFISLVSNLGTPHVDKEDVHLLGLYGNTTYQIFLGGSVRQEFTISPGDYLFIPHGQKHRVFSKTPRIILSIGFFGEMKC
tara:strand:+ start:5795 stop:6340 length:546 start_codon:yes stop_codon:yes gene_type:complete